MALLRRFTKTERAAHWLVAVAFAVMLAHDHEHVVEPRHTLKAAAVSYRRW